MYYGTGVIVFLTEITCGELLGWAGANRNEGNLVKEFRMEFKVAQILKNQSLKPGHILLLLAAVLLLSSLPIVLMQDTKEVETAAARAGLNLNPIRVKLDTHTDYNMPIPGTRISMTCPEQFLYNASSKKFTLPETSASITIEILSDKGFAEMYAHWSNPDSFLLDPEKSMDYIFRIKKVSPISVVLLGPTLITSS